MIITITVNRHILLPFFRCDLACWPSLSVVVWFSVRLFVPLSGRSPVCLCLGSLLLPALSLSFPSLYLDTSPP